MNLLSFLQGHVTRRLRQRVETMEVLVKVVQRDAKASENPCAHRSPEHGTSLIVHRLPRPSRGGRVRTTRAMLARAP